MQCLLIAFIIQYSINVELFLYKLDNFNWQLPAWRLINFSLRIRLELREYVTVTHYTRLSPGLCSSSVGLVSSSSRNKQNEAWAAILGTAVAVCVLALVVFVILKKKNQKAFSHRKLVEFSSDPGSFKSTNHWKIMKCKMQFIYVF